MTTAQKIMQILGDNTDGWWYTTDLYKRGCHITATDYDGTVSLADICEHYGATYENDADYLRIVYNFEDGSAIVEQENTWDVLPTSRPSDTLQSVLRTIRNSADYQTNVATVQLLLGLQRFCTDELARCVNDWGLDVQD